MAKRTVTYEACDGCDKALEKPGDGLVIRGVVYAAGPVPEHDRDRPLLVGARPGCRDGGSSEHALCWECWHKKVRDPVLADARRTADHYIDESYSRSASGPLPPPELPRAVEVAKALAGVGR